MTNIHALQFDRLTAEAPVAESIPGFEATLTALIGAYGVTMSIRQVAIACSLTHGRGSTRGEPNPKLVLDLVKAGGLRVIDGRQPQHRWTFAAAAVAAHIVGGV